MRAFLLALPLLIAGVGAALAETDEQLRTKIVGRWGETPACTGAILVFKEDGTFESDNIDDDPDNDMTGTYQISGGKLTGEAEDRTMPQVTLRFEGDDKVYFEADGQPTDTLVRCVAATEPPPAPAQ